MPTIPGTDLDVAPLALGGNVFGGTADESESFAVLDAYLEAGGNHVDTADVYANWVPDKVGGESEEMIGRWLASRGCRDRVVLATKVGMHDEAKGLAPATIRRGLEASLRRLGTDHVDLYYAHADDPDTPLEESLATLDALVQEGKVRHVAASNYTADRLAEALAVSDREGLARFVAFQAHYNLVRRRRYEQEVAPVVDREGLAMFPYFSLASGYLTGKYRADEDPGEGPRARMVERYRARGGHEVLRVLEEIATARSVAVPTVALAWLASRPTVTAPLASARTPDQLPALLDVATLRLSEAEQDRLDGASASF